jgi:hypothetical protein
MKTTNDNPIEKVIERKVCEYAKSLNFYVAKFVSPQRVSVPDRLLLYKGKCFFIEFKRLGEKPRPAQAIEIEKLRSHGIEVFVVDNVELGKTILNRIVLEAE